MTDRNLLTEFPHSFFFGGGRSLAPGGAGLWNTTPRRKIGCCPVCSRGISEQGPTVQLQRVQTVQGSLVPGGTGHGIFVPRRKRNCCPGSSCRLRWNHVCSAAKLRNLQDRYPCQGAHMTPPGSPNCRSVADETCNCCECHVLLKPLFYIMLHIRGAIGVECRDCKIIADTH